MFHDPVGRSSERIHLHSLWRSTCGSNWSFRWFWRQIEKHKFSPVSGTNAFLICAFWSADFLRWCLSSECNLTHNLFFLFPIVFSINLIHFFDEKKLSRCSRKFEHLFRCFDPLSRHLTEAKWRVRILRRIGTVSKSAPFLATESVNSAPFKNG